MEAKDFALLGFIDAANAYVDKHIDIDDNLGELKDIDIKTLKNELSEKLKSFVIPEDKKNDLISAGEKAFEEYAKEKLKSKRSIIDQLGETFEVNIVDDTNKDINDLFGAYDLDEKVGTTPVEEKPKNDDLDEFGLSDNDDILLKIASEAAKSDEELMQQQEQEIKQPENLDSVYAEVVNNEETKIDLNEKAIKALSDAIRNIKRVKDEVVDALVEENIEEKEEPKEEPKELKPHPEDAEVVEVNSKDIEVELVQAEPEKIYKTSENAHIPLSKILKGIGEAEQQTGYYEEKKEEPQTIEEVTEEQTETEETVEKEDKVEETIPQEEEIEELKQLEIGSFKPTFSFPADVKPADSLDILVNPGLEIYLALEKEDSENHYSFAQDKGVDMSTYSNPGLHEIEELNKAISNLNSLQKKLEKNKSTMPVNAKKEVYQSIMAAYPYLNKSFIKSAYSQKEEIENEYVEGEKYILLHRATFNDIDELHEFVEIMMSHDYSVNVDEKKMIVDTFREFINSEGFILANIFSIANQAKILGGEYEGYRVISIEGGR